MEEALYHPERGFYPRREPTRDFYTAPELTGAFAGVLFRDFRRRLEVLGKKFPQQPPTIVEMGSGSGLLARQLLEIVHRESPELERELRYVLVERSRDLLLESIGRLSFSKARVLGFVRLSDLGPCSGIFFSNELVDAFPVHLLEMEGGTLREVFVDPAGALKLGAPTRDDLLPWAGALRDAPPGTRHAVNLEALEWLTQLSRIIKSGWLMTIDYGSRYAPGVPNPPRTFRRHVQDSTGLTYPGRDITANVDFEALIKRGETLGLKLESYSTLTRFLLDGGIGDFMANEPLKVKTLLHPEAMGEVFKVLVQSSGL